MLIVDYKSHKIQNISRPTELHHHIKDINDILLVHIAMINFITKRDQHIHSG